MIQTRYPWQAASPSHFAFVLPNQASLYLLARVVTEPMAAATSAMAAVASTPARAQNAVEAEILGFHQLCDKGDRKACVRFGILIGQNQQRHADWRRAHAEWFWWDH